MSPESTTQPSSSFTPAPGTIPFKVLYTNGNQAVYHCTEWELDAGIFWLTMPDSSVFFIPVENVIVGALS